MSDDYLWDGSGEPDPEVERLENLLSRYGHQPAPLKMPVNQSRSMWSRLYSSHTMAAAAIALAIPPRGALLFSCSGRAASRTAARREHGQARDRSEKRSKRAAKKMRSPELPGLQVHPARPA